MMRHAATLLVACSLGLTLGACAGTSRFDGGFQPSSRVSSQPVYQAPLPATPAPVSAPVTAQPLPPIGGAPAPTQVSTLPGATPPDDPLFRPSPPPTAATTGSTTPPEVPTLGGAGRVATLGDGSQGAGRSGSARSGPVSSRDGVIGGWTAREVTGGTCRVMLSSSPALDLYRASAGNCQNKEIQKVTAWDYRDGEVYLYQPGGAVAARLRVNDGASMSGAVARSGAGLSLSR
ncbi:MAG: AprI/Inh family metalloprotease inhibitor [Bosea sp. (in: a-proteobacteria)]